MIAQKGTIWCLFVVFFLSLLTVSQTVSSINAQVAMEQSCTTTSHVQDTSGAHHMQHVCHMIRRDSSVIKFDSLNHIYFSFILLSETISWWRGGNQSTRRKPLMTSFRKCHILKPESSTVQAPTDTQTCTLALVTGQESRRAIHNTTCQYCHPWVSFMQYLIFCIMKPLSIQR